MSPRPVRAASFAAVAPLLVAAASFLSGCPIYSADSCDADPSCRDNTAYADAAPTYDTGTPPDDASGCGTGCGDGYVCTAQSTGRYGCSPYDCRATEKACTAPETCQQDDKGAWACGGAPVVDCTKTGCISGYKCDDVAGKKACVSTDPNACIVDGDCTAKTGAGSLCLGGVCKAPKDLCSDSTQCKGAASCVDGRCVPKCSATCATGYKCDDKTGLCGRDSTATPDPCATDGSCKSGLVCVAGSCVVDDRPVFFCDKAGSADGTQDLCATGSVCLHHNCYIACTGPSDTTTCATADKFNVCKSVTTSSGPHDVCGSSTNLGSECDPTATPAKTCAVGKVCIDGFCK
jgi:hypothetical protein